MVDNLLPPGGGIPPSPADLQTAPTGDEQMGVQAAGEGVDHAFNAAVFDRINSVNIAAGMDLQKLDEIGIRVVREYEIDWNTCADWRTKTQEAMEMAMQITREKQYPWPKASNVIFPLMTTASTQFAARAYPAIVNGRDIVKGIVVGKDDGVPMMGPNGQPMQGPNGQPMWQVPPQSKQQRANRIAEHMSWQLMEEQPEWEADTDYLLHVLPIVGCLFRKTYFDPALGRNASQTVSALHVVINYKAKSMELAPRITEEMMLYPQEIEEKVRAGAFIEHDYGMPADSGMDDDAPHHFLEQHRWLDLDEDGYREPYIVTVHKMTSKVARIVARYDADGVHINPKTGKIARIDPVHYYTKYDFLPNLEGGIYGVGFGQLLRPVNEAVNTSINMMFDAGHLQTTGGGFIGKGLSLRAGAVRFAPGEFKQVNAVGATIKDNIVPLPFSGPSAVLFQLLGLLIEAGKDIASIKDILAGDVSAANIAPTTMMALVEQGLKAFTGIYKRVYRALKHELDKLYRLNRIYLPVETSYRIGDDWKDISREDYSRGSGVEPMADPNMVSDMQRLARAQFLLGFKDDPRCNGVAIIRRVMDAAHIDRPDELVFQQPPPNPAFLKMMAEFKLKVAEQAADTSKMKAEEIRALAQAVYYLAAADKGVGDQHLAWIEAQLNILKTSMEAASAGDQAAGGQGNPQGPGNLGAGISAMAPSPGNGAVPPLPFGPAGSPLGGGPAAMA